MKLRVPGHLSLARVVAEEAIPTVRDRLGDERQLPRMTQRTCMFRAARTDNFSA